MRWINETPQTAGKLKLSQHDSASPIDNQSFLDSVKVDSVVPVLNPGTESTIADAFAGSEIPNAGPINQNAPAVSKGMPTRFRPSP